MGISFHVLAERELNDAANYDDREQPALGAAFIADVRRCTVAILEHPEAGRIIRGRVRRRLCRTFRYGVLHTDASDMHRRTYSRAGR